MCGGEGWVEGGCELTKSLVENNDKNITKALTLVTKRRVLKIISKSGDDDSDN